MAAEILVATRSVDKLEEIRAILGASLRSRLITLSDIGIEATAAEDDIEQHATFVENALAKARYFAQLTGMPVLADDSGLAVAALKGGPGVRTKRFAIDRGVAPATLAGKALDEANNELLLRELAAVADAERAAHYVCAAAFASNQRMVCALGTCSGFIARERSGEGGFGYDPLFYIPQLGVTFAQLSRAQKNARSHRARAWRALAAQLR